MMSAVHYCTPVHVFATRWCHFPTYCFPASCSDLYIKRKSMYSCLFAMRSVLTSAHPAYLQINIEQRVRSQRAIELRARTSSVSQNGVDLNRERDGIVGGTYRVAGSLWLTVLNGEQWVQQTSDLVVTLLGVCLCAFWTTFLYHLIWHTIPNTVIQ